MYMFSEKFYERSGNWFLACIHWRNSVILFSVLTLLQSVGFLLVVDCRRIAFWMNKDFKKSLRYVFQFSIIFGLQFWSCDKKCIPLRTSSDWFISYNFKFIKWLLYAKHSASTALHAVYYFGGQNVIPLIRCGHKL